MGLLKTRLGGMMFLQYAIWGVWLPVLSIYLMTPTEEGGLGFTGEQLGWLMGAAASIGAITAPFICSLADRHFSAERFLAFLLFTGGIVKFTTAFQESYTAWLFLSIVYSILYMPTLSLTNSIAFAHLKDAEKEFPKVRVWGTIGWIAASWLFPMIYLQTDLKFTAMPPFLVGTDLPDVTARLAGALKISGIVAILYAIFCFRLPHTPPKKEGVETIAVAKAFGLLKNKSILYIVIASLPISIIHQIYFIEAGPYLTKSIGLATSSVGPAMTVGQFAEIGVLALLGFFLKNFGFRVTLLMGGMGYVLRYAIWGLVAMSDDVGTMGTTIAIISQGLHGFCYACFFAAAYIYVDRMASDDIRNSAQAVFGIIILGIGPIFSGFVMSKLIIWFGNGEVVTNFSGLWFALSAVALITTIFLWIVFRDESQETPQADIHAKAEAAADMV